MPKITVNESGEAMVKPGNVILVDSYPYLITCRNDVDFHFFAVNVQHGTMFIDHESCVFRHPDMILESMKRLFKGSKIRVIQSDKVEVIVNA